MRRDRARLVPGLVLLLALPLLPCGSASTPEFVAELTVTAYGRQRLDLASGRTVLEDGGELVERGSGVRLVASWVSYAQGEEVVARDAVVEGDLGRVMAAEVVVDLVAGRVTASGGVEWSYAGLQVTGGELRFDAPLGIAWLAGDVRATRPEAAAAEVWVEIGSGRVLLMGPYRFADGPIVLTGAADGRLQLDALDTPDGIVYDARTEVEAAWLEVIDGLRRSGWSAASE